MLDVYKLRLFVSVATLNSLSRAAEVHYISQSAISQHIAQLEAYLGRRLFTRHRRGVTLTPDGEVLYRYAVQICQLIAEAELALVTLTADSEGELTLGATPNISTYRLPIWTSGFTRRYPRLRVRVQTDITARIIDDVLTGKLDIGLIEGEVDPNRLPQLRIQRLERIAHVVVVGHMHPLWGRQSLHLSELAQHKLIMRPANSHSRQWLEAIFKAHAIKPAVLLEMDNIEAMKRVVEAGDSLTILPDYTVADAVQHGRLWAIRLADVPLMRDHTAIWSAHRLPTPIAHAFIRHLGALFGFD